MLFLLDNFTRQERQFGLLFWLSTRTFGVCAKLSSFGFTHSIQNIQLENWLWQKTKLADYLNVGVSFFVLGFGYQKGSVSLFWLKTKNTPIFCCSCFHVGKENKIEKKIISLSKQKWVPCERLSALFKLLWSASCFLCILCALSAHWGCPWSAPYWVLYSQRVWRK